MHGLIAAMGRAVVRFDGTFTTTSGSSPVTSSTRNVTAGGRITFDTITTSDGTPQYNAGSGWNDITEGLALNLAIAGTLTVRASLGTPTNTATFNIKSNGKLIEAVTLTRS